jgi:excisionase family DNA binding protein
MKMCSILTAAEVAKQLRIHINLVYELINQGKLKAKKVGREYRITKTNLEAFLNNEQ